MTNQIECVLYQQHLQAESSVDHACFNTVAAVSTVLEGVPVGAAEHWYVYSCAQLLTAGAGLGNLHTDCRSTGRWFAWLGWEVS